MSSLTRSLWEGTFGVQALSLAQYCSQQKLSQRFREKNHSLFTGTWSSMDHAGHSEKTLFRSSEGLYIMSEMSLSQQNACFKNNFGCYHVERQEVRARGRVCEPSVCVSEERGSPQLRNGVCSSTTAFPVISVCAGVRILYLSFKHEILKLFV